MIKLVIFDIDGIFTDGSIWYGEQGENQKRFHTLDGMGVRLLEQAGIKTAIITARPTPIVNIRAKQLGIEHIYTGNDIKLQPYEELKSILQLNDDVIAYMGDDLADYPVMKKAGLAITVPNACEEIKQIADWETKTPGGHGAVREAATRILKEADLYDKAIQKYLFTHGHTE